MRTSIAIPHDLRATLASRYIFTTGEIARLCHVAPRTVSKWIDSGSLVGYRLPGCNDRRVCREQLIRFMARMEIPLGILAGHDQVLLAGVSEVWRERLAASLYGTYRLVSTDSLFRLAVIAADVIPPAVILSATLGGVACQQAAETLRNRIPHTMLVGLLADDGDDPGCYDLAVRESDDPALVTAALLSRRAG